MLCAAAAAWALQGCGERRDRPSAQVAAVVDGDELTIGQVNQVLAQQRHLRPEQGEPASRQVLERLVDQQLAVQQAIALKLDREPRVQQQLELARKEVLARAWGERMSEAVPKADEAAIKAYFDARPILFAQRRVYLLTEVQVEARAEQVDALRQLVRKVRTLEEFTTQLRSGDWRFVASQVRRAAEQLPLQQIDAIARLQPGQAMGAVVPGGMQVLFLQGTQDAPLSLEQARPLIEQYLINERRRRKLEDEIKALREKANIEYLGRFAPVPSAQAASQASAASAAVPQR